MKKLLQQNEEMAELLLEINEMQLDGGLFIGWKQIGPNHTEVIHGGTTGWDKQYLWLTIPLLRAILTKLSTELPQPGIDLIH
jgi:hypothetical protein